MPVPVVDHVVDHVIKTASQLGTAIRVVGEKTVVNGDVDQRQKLRPA